MGQSSLPRVGEGRGRGEPMNRQWRNAGFAPQSQPLRHAKAVLLVNDGKREVFKHHLVLNDCMRANNQTCMAAGDHGQCLAPFPGLLAAGQPGGLNAQWLQPGDEFSEMLLGQNLGRCHQRALPASINAARCGQCCNHCFAGANITLQQAVHRHIFLQVSSDLCAHPLLRNRQLKRQTLKQLVMQGALCVLQRAGHQRRRTHGAAHAARFKLRQLLGQ